MQLKNKVAVVTGAASGIGKEIAEVFAREGAKVAIVDLDQKKSESVAEAMRANKQEAIGIGMDVTQEKEVEAGIAKVVSTYGRVDILISNAGIQTISPVEELPFDKWKQLLAIQLDGAFLTTRECLKHMYKSGGGSIIYMGSVHCKEASKLKAPYVTSKHGLLGLCRVVAKEGAAHNVRANIICPGYVRTPLVDKQIPAQAKELGITEEEVVKKVFLKDTVDGEFTSTEDIARVALFFASFPSNALTGESLIISHGWFMS